MSPSQASETCASASSATSAKYRHVIMRMHLEGVKNASPATMPIAISIEITVAIPAGPIAYLDVSGPATTAEDVVGETYPAIRPAAVPAAIPRVVAVNEL